MFSPFCQSISEGLREKKSPVFFNSNAPPELGVRPFSSPQEVPFVVIVNIFAAIVVVVFGFFLIGLACVAFAKPVVAERFFMSFASSARAHYTEQAFRLLIGASIVVLSPVMWQANLFRIAGWLIVISTLGLLLTPWRWHHRFGQQVLPLLARHLRLYAVGLIVFGVLLLLGVFCGSSHISA